MKSAEFLKLEHLLRASFSLNKYKADMLTFLLINGESQMNEMKVDVPRPRTYDIITALEKGGFIKIIKKENKNGIGKLHKYYKKTYERKFIPFDLQKIINNRKKQEQLQLNEKFKVMNGFKKQIEEQIKTISSSQNVHNTNMGGKDGNN